MHSIILLTDSQGNSIYARLLMLLIPYFNGCIFKNGLKTSPGPNIDIRLKCYKISLDLDSVLQDKQTNNFAVACSKSFNFLF